MKFLNCLLFFIIVYVEVAVAAPWPRVDFPTNAAIETIGNNVRLNGVPVRMYQVKVRGRLATLKKFYQDKLGKNHAVKHLQNGLILSQAKDHYFITIRITPLGA